MSTFVIDHISKVCSSFKGRRSRYIAHVAHVQLSASSLHPDLAAQLHVQQGEQAADSAGHQRKSNGGDFEDFRPYDGEGHYSLMVLDVELQLGVDLLHHGVDHVAGVGQ